MIARLLNILRRPGMPAAGNHARLMLRQALRKERVMCPHCGSLSPMILGWLGDLFWVRCTGCHADYTLSDTHQLEEEEVS